MSKGAADESRGPFFVGRDGQLRALNVGFLQCRECLFRLKRYAWHRVFREARHLP